jgi:hypothetical protein
LDTVSVLVITIRTLVSLTSFVNGFVGSGLPDTFHIGPKDLLRGLAELIRIGPGGRVGSLALGLHDG